MAMAVAEFGCDPRAVTIDGRGGTGTSNRYLC